ncbi:MAG TPA: hypothetical protein VFP40_00900 [Terriglobales bacterium]|nr:hypothetical protein [Terriglobales bacterium]
MENIDLLNISEAAREAALRHICDNWPAIVAKIIEITLKDGSVPHAKFLMEWSELASPLAATKEAEQKESKPAEKKEEKSDGDFSLAQLIFETLAAYDRGEWST